MSVPSIPQDLPDNRRDLVTLAKAHDVPHSGVKEDDLRAALAERRAALLDQPAAPNLSGTADPNPDDAPAAPSAPATEVVDRPSNAVEAVSRLKPNHDGDGKPGERRKIREINDRGDWRDPFTGQLITYTNEVNPANHVARDGDEAVWPEA